MDDPKPEKTSRAVWIFWTIFFLSLFFNQWLRQFFWQTRPSIPDPSTGRIYQISKAGRVMYLTFIEYAAAYAHWVLSVVALAALIVWKLIRELLVVFGKDREKKD